MFDFFFVLVHLHCHENKCLYKNINTKCKISAISKSMKILLNRYYLVIGITYISFLFTIQVAPVLIFS